MDVAHRRSRDLNGRDHTYEAAVDQRDVGGLDGDVVAAVAARSIPSPVTGPSAELPVFASLICSETKVTFHLLELLFGDLAFRPARRQKVEGDLAQRRWVRRTLSQIIPRVYLLSKWG